MSYIARFRDELGNTPTRRFFASYSYQANRKATAIAKSHGWAVVSVGSA